MLVQISEIKVNPGRREASPEAVQELAHSISTVGLLNPITIDRERTLIAGLHRLEAVKVLGWAEVECTVSSLEGLEAELAEIDENVVRNDLPVMERNDIMLHRKEIYEQIHPETRHGMRNGQTSKDAKFASLETKSFAEDTAEKLGISKSTVAHQIQAAKNTTPEAKRIIRDSNAKITQQTALKLSRLPPEQQEEAASLLASGAIKSVDEYQAVKQKNPGARPAPPTPPFAPEEPPFASDRESVADLKDPNKDCSCTPDSFLAEIAAFVEKFHREIEWFSIPYYTVVFPALQPTQIDYLRQQLASVHAAAEELLHQVERTIEK